MPKPRSGGYEALPALDEELDNDQEEATGSHARETSNGIARPLNTRRPHQRTRSSTLSITNLSEIDVKLKQWTHAVARRFAKGKGALEK